MENGIFHGISRQRRQIMCSSVMPRRIQAVGVGKMGTGKAQSMSLVIHQLHKALHGAAAVNSQGHRRIVAGMEHQAVEKFLNCQHFPLLQIHGGPFDAHRFLRNPHPVQHIALLADNERRHDFRSAGNKALFVNILFKEDTACGSVQQNGFFSRNCPGLHR